MCVHIILVIAFVASLGACSRKTFPKESHIAAPLGNLSIEECGCKFRKFDGLHMSLALIFIDW